LRGAIEAADAAGGGPHTINVPAGTYNLTLGEISFGNNAQNISIVGAGAGLTIINMTNTAQDRIFIINPPGTISNVTTSISGVTFTNGHLTSDVYGGGAIICGGPNNSTTITNCVFNNNSVGTGSSSGGGALNMQGGGALVVDQCTFTNNTTGSVTGGAIDIFLVGYANLTGSVNITNCNFTGNSVTASPYATGGAITVVTQTPNTGQTFPVSIQKNSFVNNSVKYNGPGNDGGGAIYVESGFPTNINYNRFTGNKLGSTLDAILVSNFQPGTTNASNNWWGCNDDPAAASACAEKAYMTGSVGSGTLVSSPRLQLKTTSASSTICQSGATTTLVTTSFLSNSANSAISSSNLTQLAGLPVSFSVVNGSLSGAQSSIQSGGTATVTFNGNTGAGNSSVNAVVDNLPNNDALARASMVVSSAPTITAGGQPASINGCASGNVNFTLTVSSTQTPAYQWYKGLTALQNGATGTGSTISGATTATLTIANPGAGDIATNYKCVATTTCGQVISNTAALSVYGSRLYVASGSSGGGSSWADALGDLTAALNIASGCSSITEIWVKSGTYYPSAKPFGTSTAYNQDEAFTLVNGVTAYGGFAGNETTLAQRNINANPTILSGDIGTLNNSSDNCYHVVVSVSNNNTAVIDGFTIMGGNAIGSGSAIYQGIGVSRSSGGGISLSNSSAVVVNCKITGNNASAGGGGLFQGGGSIKVSNCVFSGNSATYGGAVRDENTPSLTIINSVFSGNSSSQSGAAMSLYLGKDTVANNLFIKNYDHGITQGGGALCTSSADFYIVNNTFFADTTQGRGGAISSESISGTLQLYNNIFYKNYAEQGNNDVDNATTSYTQANNLFSTTNPLFVNESDADGPDNIWATKDDGMNLQSASPAFDAGDNSKIPAGITTDITGAARIQGGIVNLSAYESGDYAYTTIYVDSSIAVAGDGGTWATAFKTMSDAVKIVRRFTNVNTVYVAKGTYYPTGSPVSASSDSAFVIQRGGVKMYGGYPAGGGIRNINVNPTYLDGEINTAASNDNSYHIMVVAGIGNAEDSIVVDGFTFRNGSATGANVKIYNGTSINSAFGAALALLNVTNGQRTLFRQCTFSNNTANTGGGALFQSGGAAYFTGCVFSNNSAYYGGAVRNESFPVLTVINSVFSGNVTAQSGGAMSLYQGTDTLVNNLFVKNTDNSTTQGGGALCTSTANFYFANNTFYADTTHGKGGAISAESSAGTLSLYNNIFYKNHAAIASDDVNDVTLIYNQAYNSFGTTNPIFTNEADIDGPDNTWATADDGLNLQVTSPAFDAGNNTKVLADVSTDITGASRIQNGVVNLGAYETGVYSHTTIYVDSSIAVAGDGGTWATALKALSDAVNIARRAGNVNTIRVAKGTYYPTGSQFSSDRDSAFAILRGGLKMYGGYPSGGSNSRNYNLYPTYLDGNINTTANYDNSYHIMVLAGIGSNEDSVIIDGFVLRNGHANGGVKTYNGLLVGSSYGGAVSLYNVNNAQKTLFRHCTFSNNTASLGGGALFQSGGMVYLNGCVFSNNSAPYGGAVRDEGNPVLTAINSVFTGNVTTQSGGAMSLYLGTDTLINNLFVKNTVSSNTQGGGALCTSTANLYFVNNTFYADTTNGKGGAISAESVAGTLSIFNNVFFKNYSALGNNDIDNITATYQQANNSVGADPFFANESNLIGADSIWATGDDGLRLKMNSPVINAGDNSKLPAGITTDIGGGNRIENGTVDLGAFEKKVVTVVGTISGDTSVCTHSAGPQVLFSGSGGTRPYTFTYKLNGVSHNIVTLSGDTVSVSAPTTTAGSFVYKLVSVKDKGNNTSAVNDSIIVKINASPSAVLGPVNTDICYGAYTFVTVSQVKGGAKPYQYSINGGTTYQDTVRFNVPAGSYNVVVKDSIGCTATTDTVIVTQPDSIAVNMHVTAASCGNNNITVTPTGGWGSYLYSLNNSAFQSSNTFTNVGIGSKSIRVKDAKGCAKGRTITINPLSATAAAGATQVCYNSKASITVMAKNGLTPYRYSIDSGATYQDTTRFIVMAGSYSITVKDSAGCTFVTGKITITQPAAPLSISETHTDATCPLARGSIIVSGNGGYGSYLYSLNSSGVYMAEDTFSDLIAATYTVHVKDAKGCTAGKSVTIHPPPGPCGFLVTTTPDESSLLTSVKLSVKAYPNPSPAAFTLLLQGGNENEPVELRVMDVNGKAVYQARGTVHTTFSFGQTFTSGVYLAQVFNGKNVQAIKLVKGR
jgi:hypothetical protein